MDYQLNLQRGTKPYRRGDFAMEPLFTYVKEEVCLKNKTKSWNFFEYLFFRSLKKIPLNYF